MLATTAPPLTYIGIDVAKRFLDIAIGSDGEPWRTPNTADGIDALIARVQQLAGPQQVVLEASGRWERALVAALEAVGVPVAVVNPRQVRDFARASGRLAKTDRLDAQLLAHYGEALQPAPRPRPDADQQRLAALVTRRHQLVAMRAAERNRRKSADPASLASLAEHIAWLSERIDALERELTEVVKANPDWQAQLDRLTSAPGVGFVVGVTLLAELPELGRLSHKPLAALVGLAPLNRDSGQLRGRRHIWGGRAAVRAVLYLAARVAAQHNSVFRAHFEQLTARGKPLKVARVACARKLLTQLNAMTRDQAAWRPPTPKEVTDSNHSTP